MRVLYVSTVGGTMNFFLKHIEMLIKEGNTVELASNWINPVNPIYTDWGLVTHSISFSRSPFSKSNIQAYKQLKQLLLNGNYDIVHCHTPNAAAITRLVCKDIRKKGLKVIYTAHGFHFYKGAPLKNWLIYYPIEWICSHWTDVLITINIEDYIFAQKKMKAEKVVYVPGVGIDLEKFNRVTVNRKNKRAELGIPENATLLLSVGELNKNKNHEAVIRAICGMDVYYIIAGQGDEKEHLVDVVAEVGMADRVKLLGFRADVMELYSIANVFVFPSFREGLSVSLMEAMAMGLPCAVSNIRGNTDLIDDCGGTLFNPASNVDCKEKIQQLLNANRTTMGEYNSKKLKNFEIKAVVEQIKDIYQSVI